MCLKHTLSTVCVCVCGRVGRWRPAARWASSRLSLSFIACTTCQECETNSTRSKQGRTHRLSIAPKNRLTKDDDCSYTLLMISLFLFCVLGSGRESFWYNRISLPLLSALSSAAQCIYASPSIMRLVGACRRLTFLSHCARPPPHVLKTSSFGGVSLAVPYRSVRCK